MRYHACAWTDSPREDSADCIVVFALGGCICICICICSFSLVFYSIKNDLLYVVMTRSSDCMADQRKEGQTWKRSVRLLLAEWNIHSLVYSSSVSRYGVQYSLLCKLDDIIQYSSLCCGIYIGISRVSYRIVSVEVDVMTSYTFFIYIFNY